MCINCGNINCSCDSNPTYNWYNARCLPEDPCAVKPICKSISSAKCTIYNGPTLNAFNITAPNDLENIIKIIDSNITELRASIIECCRPKECTVIATAIETVSPTTTTTTTSASTTTTTSASTTTTTVDLIANWNKVTDTQSIVYTACPGCPDSFSSVKPYIYNFYHDSTPVVPDDNVWIKLSLSDGTHIIKKILANTPWENGPTKQYAVGFSDIETCNSAPNCGVTKQLHVTNIIISTSILT
jgi:hypothetical protein